MTGTDIVQLDEEHPVVSVGVQLIVRGGSDGNGVRGRAVAPDLGRVQFDARQKSTDGVVFGLLARDRLGRVGSHAPDGGNVEFDSRTLEDVMNASCRVARATACGVGVGGGQGWWRQS